jgi:hypothetical protein
VRKELKQGILYPVLGALVHRPHRFMRYFQRVKFLFECVEKSHTGDQALHFDCGGASWSHRLCPMLMGYTDISVAPLTVRGETLRLPARKDRV